MNKIVLKNKQQYNIAEVSTESDISIVIESVDEVADIYSNLTNENLSEYQILSDNDVLCAIYKNKTLDYINVRTVEVKDIIDGVEEVVESFLCVTAHVKNLDNTQLRIAELETKVAELEAKTK